MWNRQVSDTIWLKTESPAQAGEEFDNEDDAKAPWTNPLITVDTQHQNLQTHTKKGGVAKQDITAMGEFNDL